MDHLPNSLKQLHARAVELSRRYRETEWLIIQVLQEIDAANLYKRLGFPSLFQYAVQALGFSESVAYSFISVSRKALEVVELQKAIKAQILTVAKASRMVAGLTIENASELVKFAIEHSSREIDLEVARRNPSAAPREQLKVIAKDRVQLKFCLSKATFENLKRAQDLIAQKNAKHLNIEATLELIVTDYINRFDPLQKALRRKERAAKLCTFRVQKQDGKNRRPAIPAQAKHAVALRDKGQCTFVDSLGRRCLSQRWLHIHHVRAVIDGGDNQPENLKTLCSFHHDLIHQLSLPIDGQVSWIKSMEAGYQARWI